MPFIALQGVIDGCLGKPELIVCDAAGIKNRLGLFQCLPASRRVFAKGGVKCQHAGSDKGHADFPDHIERLLGYGARFLYVSIVEMNLGEQKVSLGKEIACADLGGDGNCVFQVVACALQVAEPEFNETGKFR